MPEYQNLFPSLPDTARVWVYAAHRLLSEDEQTTLIGILTPFLSSWTSHGRRVIGQAQILENRLLIIAATLAEGDISGCGIDASTHAVEEAGRVLGVEWLPGLLVLYRDQDNAVQAVSRPIFRDLVRRGVVEAGTPVFDTSLTTLSELRSGNLEKPAGASWHGRAFQISPAPL